MDDLGISKTLATALVIVYLIEVSYMNKIRMIRNVSLKITTNKNVETSFLPKKYKHNILGLQNIFYDPCDEKTN